MKMANYCEGCGAENCRLFNANGHSVCGPCKRTLEDKGIIRHTHHVDPKGMSEHDPYHALVGFWRDGGNG